MRESIPTSIHPHVELQAGVRSKPLAVRMLWVVRIATGVIGVAAAVVYGNENPHRLRCYATYGHAEVMECRLKVRSHSNRTYRRSC